MFGESHGNVKMEERVWAIKQQLNRLYPETQATDNRTIL